MPASLQSTRSVEEKNPWAMAPPPLQIRSFAQALRGEPIPPQPTAQSQPVAERVAHWAQQQANLGPIAMTPQASSIMHERYDAHEAYWYQSSMGVPPQGNHQLGYGSRAQALGLSASPIAYKPVPIAPAQPTETMKRLMDPRPPLHRHYLCAPTHHAWAAIAHSPSCGPVCYLPKSPHLQLLAPIYAQRTGPQRAWDVFGYALATRYGNELQLCVEQQRQDLRNSFGAYVGYTLKESEEEFTGVLQFLLSQPSKQHILEQPIKVLTTMMGRSLWLRTSEIGTRAPASCRPLVMASLEHVDRRELPLPLLLRLRESIVNGRICSERLVESTPYEGLMPPTPQLIELLQYGRYNDDVERLMNAAHIVAVHENAWIKFFSFEELFSTIDCPIQVAVHPLSRMPLSTEDLFRIGPWPSLVYLLGGTMPPAPFQGPDVP